MAVRCLAVATSHGTNTTIRLAATTSFGAATCLGTAPPPSPTHLVHVAITPLTPITPITPHQPPDRAQQVCEITHHKPRPPPQPESLTVVSGARQRQRRYVDPCPGCEGTLVQEGEEL